MTRGAKLIALAKNAEVVKDLEEILDDSFEDPNFSDETDTSDCQSTDGMESILSALSPNKECKLPEKAALKSNVSRRLYLHQSKPRPPSSLDICNGSSPMNPPTSRPTEVASQSKSKVVLPCSSFATSTPKPKPAKTQFIVISETPQILQNNENINSENGVQDDSFLTSPNPQSETSAFSTSFRSIESILGLKTPRFTKISGKTQILPNNENVNSKNISLKNSSSTSPNLQPEISAPSTSLNGKNSNLEFQTSNRTSVPSNESGFKRIALSSESVLAHSSDNSNRNGDSLLAHSSDNSTRNGDSLFAHSSNNSTSVGDSPFAHSSINSTHAGGTPLVQPSNNSTPARTDWVTALLNETREGQLILSWFDKTGSLSMTKRSKLVKKIMEEELEKDPSKSVQPERFEEIASAICKIFPTEEKSTYYTAYFRDASGNAHNARGKLYDKYKKLRTDFRAEGLIMGRCFSKKKEESTNSEDNNELAVNPEIETADAWLQSNTEPQETVVKFIQISCSYRLAKFQRTPGKEIYNYLALYPSLSQPNGYILVNDKILTLHALSLLAIISPTVTVKKKWRPSKIEAKDGFFIFATSEDEAKEKVERRNAKLQLHGIEVLPTAVVITPPSPNNWLHKVILKDIHYDCPSALKCIDVCMKLFVLLQVPVPSDSLLTWHFLKTYVYNFSSNAELLYPSLKQLKKDLKF
ncbi:unnamed protein product [Bemisia tabaci]|uniref:Uncharacterized protein n=1 Tax=Bemisia tabaci TaxID=7038 RepID=A0AAI8UPT5_BEMTA|nr:unnamed protein product [Bemisia tabaci]